MENHKLAIIYGVADIAKNIGDGQIERLGDSKLEHEYHSANLLAEAKKRYSEASIFQKLTYRHRPEVISYFFTLFGHIVFQAQVAAAAGVHYDRRVSGHRLPAI